MNCLVFRVCRSTNSVRDVLKRVHVRLPQQIAASQTQSYLLQTSRCPGSQWISHTRSLHVGAQFCSKDDRQKSTDHVSVSRSSYTPPGLSAAQKGTVRALRGISNE